MIPVRPKSQLLQNPKVKEKKMTDFRTNTRWRMDILPPFTPRGIADHTGEQKAFQGLDGRAG